MEPPDTLPDTASSSNAEQFEMRLSLIEREFEDVRSRNSRVTADKAWETSITRRVLVASLTFLFTSLVFASIEVEEPLKNALIPTTGYIVSTFSVPWVKAWWIKRS